MRKVCIIGGGSAGLSAEIALTQLKIETDLYERFDKWGPGALGFIILSNGLLALDTLGLGKELRSQSAEIQNFILKSQKGEILLKKKLDKAFGVKRRVLLEILQKKVSPEHEHSGNKFSHFEYHPSGKIASACFEDGKSVEADFFLGCDGVHSKVRKELFPNYQVFEKFPVKEITCMVHHPKSIEIGKNFIKTQHEEGGISFGLVPCSENELIWFMQFDSKKWDLEGSSPEEKKRFVYSMVGEWPDPIPEILEMSDYYHTHVWSMMKMSPLPHYHVKNAILLGDAAHTFLPFTSQGVNTALYDGVTVAQKISETKLGNFEEILNQYDSEHHKMIEKFERSGIEIAEHFLHPKEFIGGEVIIPLARQ